MRIAFSHLTSEVAAIGSIDAVRIGPGGEVDLDRVIGHTEAGPFTVADALGELVEAFKPERPASPVEGIPAEHELLEEDASPAHPLYAMNTDAAHTAVTALTAPELDAWEAAERDHPKYLGGRTRVLRSIDERRQALLDKE